MGIIQTESIKNTIVNFIGTFIGILSILFVVPLEKEIYGYAQWLYSTALIITPLIGLGLPTLIIKYYPEFVRRGKESNFLSFILVFGLLLLVTTSLVIYALQPYLLGIGVYLGFQTEKIVANGSYILILSILLFLIACLVSYTSTRNKIVIPDLINNVGFKIALPIFILLYYFNWIDERLMAITLVLFFGINFLILLIYSIQLSKVSIQPNLGMIREIGWKNFAGYLGFSSLNSISYYLVFRLDIIMIGLLIDDAAVGIYAIVMVMANVLDIPTKAIAKIASPIISLSWINKDIQNIKKIYTKSASNLTFIGQFLFLLIVFGLKDLLALLPGERIGEEAFYVFLLLGMGKIFDMITSLNTHIIMYSHKYRFNLFFLSLQGLLNIFLNYIFISIYGMVGAALATCISLVIYNVIKYLYIYNVFKIGIYSGYLIRTIIIGIAVFLTYFMLPDYENNLFNMSYKILVCTSSYLGLALIFNANKELSDKAKWFKKILRRIH